MKKFYIKKSAIAGRGVYSGEFIEKGKFVLTMTGLEIHKVYKTKNDLRIGKTWVSIGMHKWLKPDSPVKYMNHSCDANLGFKTPTKLYARRDIKTNEELTIDYSTVEYVDFWSLPCSCGSKKCRKQMRPVQYLSKAVYKSYLPYIPSFFQKVYLQYHNGYKPRR